MYLLDFWCQQQGVIQVIRLIKTGLSVIRWVVPIGLIVMTGLDVFKKVINPDDKDGQKKILNRLIAAIIVFFVPLLVRFVLKLVSVGGGSNNISSCWESVR